MLIPPHQQTVRATSAGPHWPHCTRCDCVARACMRLTGSSAGTQATSCRYTSRHQPAAHRFTVPARQQPTHRLLSIRFTVFLTRNKRDSSSRLIAAAAMATANLQSSASLSVTPPGHMWCATSCTQLFVMIHDYHNPRRPLLHFPNAAAVSQLPRACVEQGAPARAVHVETCVIRKPRIA